MTAPRDSYIPISCEFHDVLEATATRRRVAEIEFLDANGAHRMYRDRISTLSATNGEEFLVLESGARIRLDQLLAVDGQRRADFAD